MADEQQAIQLSGPEALQRHEDQIATLVEAIAEVAEQVTRLVSRVLDGEKRLTILETDQREVEMRVRDSLDQIGTAMAEIHRVIMEHRRQVQGRATGPLN